MLDFQLLNILRVVHLFNIQYFLWHQEELNKLFQEKFVKKLCTSFSDEDWNDFLQLFLDRILKIYRPEQIIFHEYYCVSKYISKDGEICSYKPERLIQRKQQNALLKKLNQMAKERLQGCHVITMPEGVLANARHKWGIIRFIMWICIMNMLPVL